MALPEFPRMSVEDYLLLDKLSSEARYEYLDGQLRMLAGGSLNHALIAANLTGMLRDHLRGSPCAAYTSDARVQLAESRYVYPDLTVSCQEQEEEDDMIHHPRVIFEVLSPSTEAYDRSSKFAAYRECSSLEDYVLVDSQRQLVEVYHREKRSWTYTIYNAGDTVEIRSIEAFLPMSEIYERTRLKQG